MRVMFWGTLHPTLAVLPSMRERRTGRIVNVTSIGGKLSFPHLLPYNAAKFAAVGLTEGLHAELARDGVGVTTVVPGLMRTGSHLNAQFKSRAAREFGWFGIGATTPLLAMKADRAARRILTAAAMGKAEIVLTPQAKLAARLSALFPSSTARVLSVVNRLLPGEGGIGTDRRSGREARGTVTSILTAAGERPARRFGQYPK
jgi:short-subunit dehydrogenase